MFRKAGHARARPCILAESQKSSRGGSCAHYSYLNRFKEWNPAAFEKIFAPLGNYFALPVVYTGKTTRGVGD